jgi:two-component system chemotaxis response regulator CheB
MDDELRTVERSLSTTVTVWMDFCPIVVIGASEGGVSALRALHAELPEELPAAVLVVLHIGAHESELAEILNRGGPLHACQPMDGDRIHRGHFYVAPPDHHMIVTGHSIRLTKGPRENFARPSIDPLFRSAAENYGAAAIGVILTGGLNDGTAGLYEIKRRSGVTVVQDPSEAVNPSMPRSALAHVAVDHCTSLALMPELLQRIVAERIAASPQPPSEALESDMTAEFVLDRPVAVTCPDCGGALQQKQLGTLTQFSCHIGHVYTAETMLAGQFKAMEQSIEAAMRSLNERAELCREMAELAGPQQASADEWKSAMEEALTHTALLKELLGRKWMHPALVAPRRTADF